MGARLTCRLVFVLLVVLLLAAYHVVAYFHARRIAKQETYYQCCLLLDGAAAVRSYVLDVLRPAVDDLLSEEGFIPEAMSAAFVANRYLARLAALRPGLYHKIVSRHPRSPRNRPTPQEMELIQFFEQRPVANQWYGEIELGAPSAPYVLVARPIRFTAGCLRCHGDPATALPAVRQRYADRGFGFQAGDVAVQVVALPLDRGVPAPWRLALGFFAPAAALTLIVFLVGFWLFEHYVALPLALLGRAMPRLAAGDPQALPALHGLGELEELGRQAKAMAQTIAERREEEKRLMAEANRARLDWERTFDGVPDSIAIIDPDYRIRRVNRALAERLGRRPEEIEGMACYRLLDGLERPPADCPLRRALQEGRAVERLVRDSPLGPDVLQTVSPLLLDDGSYGVVHVGRDISALQQARREVAAARRYLVRVLDQCADAVMVVDRQYRIQLANQEARKRYQGPMGEVWSCYQACHGCEEHCIAAGEAEECPAERVFATGRPLYGLSHRHGPSKTLEEVNAAPLFDEKGEVEAVVMVSRDIEERMRIEEELRELHAQRAKEESLRTLAGGIAHDYNNALTAVLGNAELIKEQANGAAVGRYADNIITAARQMTMLVRQLIAYAREGRCFPSTMPVRDLLAAALERAEISRGKGQEVVLDVAEDCWEVAVDREQAVQALANCLTNAFEALGKEGGKVRVQAQNVVRQAWTCQHHHRHPAGEYVEIRIVDNGPGIAPQHLSRIFDPFFSTRFMGRGLGLPAALGIVANHGGCLTVMSAVGEGTTVLILLPRHRSGKKPAANQRPQLRHGTVLVVDDESLVLEYVREVLTRAGYKVQTVGDGGEALAMLDHLRPALVLLDIQMPGLDGREVYRRLKARYPDLPVVLASGYDEQTALAGLELGPEDGFLPKPYRISDLIETVRTYVARSGPDTPPTPADHAGGENRHSA